MRGKDCQNVSIFLFHRITPAYAGKSSRGSPVQTAFTDHPRLCGEKQFFIW